MNLPQVIFHVWPFFQKAKLICSLFKCFQRDSHFVKSTSFVERIGLMTVARTISRSGCRRPGARMVEPLLQPEEHDQHPERESMGQLTMAAARRPAGERSRSSYVWMQRSPHATHRQPAAGQCCTKYAVEVVEDDGLPGAVQRSGTPRLAAHPGLGARVTLLCAHRRLSRTDQGDRSLSWILSLGLVK